YGMGGDGREQARDSSGRGDRRADHGGGAAAPGLGRDDPRMRPGARTGRGGLAARFGDPQLVALRADVVDLLAGRLPAGVLRTGVTVTGVDAGDADRRARVATSAGDLDADLVVAADGIGSRIRTALFPDSPGPRYSGFTTWRFVAPAVPAGAGRAEPAETWGRGEVFGVLPLASGQVYCYASAPAPPGIRHDDEAAELKRRFAHW